MLYRIRLDLAFETEAPRLALFNMARAFVSKAITINPGEENQEVGYLMTEECHHDEHPPQPCVVTKNLTT